MDQVGIRELRNNISTIIRQAGDGVNMVVTVDGMPVAHLGPLRPLDQPPRIEELAARGELLLARRPATPEPSASITLSQGERIDRIIREVRGR